MTCAEVWGLILSTTAVAACSGGASGPDATLGDPDVLVGTFAVELIAPADAGSDGLTSVIGAVHDAAQPAAIQWDVSTSDGPCTLLLPRVPFCSVPCGGIAVCVADEVCQDYATRQDVGTVHVSGLHTDDGASEFAMEPVVNNYQPPAGLVLAYPAFAEGDPIRFVAEGSAFTGGFTLEVAGIAPLELTSADPTLTRDQPVALTWALPADDRASVVGVKLDISHHGGSKGKIECEAPDLGSLSIGAALVTELLDLGAAGFPTIIVSREVTGTALSSAGRVELEVDAEVERPVIVPGIESCNDDDDCTNGETCQDDLTCG